MVTLTEMQELMTREEPLVDDLKPYEYVGPLGLGVHHPLVIELFYDPQRAALLNERYRLKVRERDAARAKGDWSNYVFIHERPYRIRALMSAMTSGSQDHRLVRDAWTDSENIFQNKTAWQRIWRMLKDPRKTMNANEATVYEWMPDTLTIHRGIRHETHWPRGMSWTRDFERAVWFAHRRAENKHRPAVLTATVQKKHVLAFFNGRNEEEVVVMPRNVRITKTDVRQNP